MTTEIVDLIDDRRIAKQCQDSEKYREKDRMIRKKCIAAKEKWFNEKCEEIEYLSQKNPQLIHEKVKNLSKPEQCISSGCIKGKDGSIIMDKEKILNRWEEYISELYDDEERGVKTEIRKNMDEPSILQSEVEHAIN